MGTTTTTTITVFLSSLDTSWTNGTRTAYWYLGSPNGGIPTENAYYKTKTASIEDKASSGGQVTFTGLEPDTNYGIYCAVYHGSEFLAGIQGYVWTDSEGSGGGGSGAIFSVAVWDWAISNGSASAEQTQTASNATASKGYVRDFSYLVWNDMVDKAKEILDAIGETWDSGYASYEATRMTSSDRKLTAKRFNSLRYNIGSRYSTGIAEVEKGDIVYGSYFRTLASKMTFWIYELQGDVIH
jgi:hypothetical protein